MVDVKNNKIFNSLNFSKRQIYQCDVAAKAYVSASKSDSDEHEVLSI